MSDEEIKHTAELLKKLQPGYLPYPIFEQIARIVALPILELVPYRINEGKIEILLLERPGNDPIWPGILHTPGTVIRPDDLHEETHGLQAAFERLIHNELDDAKIGLPKFIASILHESKRGVEQAQVYCAELLEEPRVGKLFLADQLPEKLMAHQGDFINKVINFLRNQ